MVRYQAGSAIVAPGLAYEKAASDPILNFRFSTFNTHLNFA